MVEVLDQNWVRKGFTAAPNSVRFTEELGQVGDFEVKVPVNDDVVNALPNPDAVNPYEGRARIYEDNALVFAGVIDSRRTDISESAVEVTFGGKQRGIFRTYSVNSFATILLRKLRLKT
jgi:hypothetical protein